jgi:ABC-type nitrate/sulfonate/bicarbonate transport system permease component
VGPATRPAEWGTAAAGLAFLLLRALGVDDTATLTALTVVIAFVPAAVTSTVEWLRRQRRETAP